MTRILEIMKELLDYTEYTSLMVYFALGGMVITFLLFWFLKKHRWAKYMPGLAMLLFGIFSLFRMDISTEQFLQDRNMIWFITGTAVGISTMLFGLILGVFAKEKKVKKPKKKRKAEPGIEGKEVDI